MLKIKGEKASADVEAADEFVSNFPDIVADRYHPENIYNADETGMYWRCLPDTTLALDEEKLAFGAKLSKERITLLVCANALGTHKVDLLAIGKAARPRGFPKSRAALPLKYANSKKAWMTRELFEWWYDKIFIPQVEEFQERNGNKGDVLLVLDNAPVHHKDTDFDRKGGRFKVIFLPPNVTSLIQPIDQSIIAGFKKIYRSSLLSHVINFFENNPTKTLADYKQSFKLFNAIQEMKTAWDSMTKKALANGWKNILKNVQWQSEGELIFHNSLESVEIVEFLEEAEILVDATNKSPIFIALENDDIEEESAAIEEMWDEIDEQDPGYGLFQEDDIEKAIFGDCFNESEDEEEDEGYDEDDEVFEVMANPKVSHTEAVAAGIIFENWMRVNMREEDYIIMSRFVNNATLKSKEWPQKQPKIDQIFKTLA